MNSEEPPVALLTMTLDPLREGLEDQYMFDWSAIGRECKAARKRLGLNQTEMAKRAGIAQTSLSNIEKGHTTTTSTISDLVKAAGLVLQVEVYPEGEAPPAPPPEVLEAVRALGDLSPDDRRAFIELMRVWAQLPEDLRNGTLSQWRFFVQAHGESSESNRSTA